MAGSARIITVLALVVIVFLVGTSAFAATVSEQKAKEVFEKSGCVACHNGKVAPTFDGTVSKIKEWAAKYETLDEAVQKEYTYMGGAKSYDQMMQQMRRFTPTISDEDFKLLYDYFRQVFSESKGATPTATAATTTTPARTATETATKTTATPMATVVTEEKLPLTTPPPTVTVGPSTTLPAYNVEVTNEMNRALFISALVLALAVAVALMVYYGRK